MSFIGKFFLAVLVLGFVELYLLIQVAGQIGFFGTLGLCIFTGVVGGAIVRRQGLQTVEAIQSALQRGRVPTVEIVSGLVLLLVGTMLLTPGFVTDAVGFALLIPPVRQWAASLLARAFEGRIEMGPPPPTGKPGHTGRPRERHGGREVIDIDPEG